VRPNRPDALAGAVERRSWKRLGDVALLGPGPRPSQPAASGCESLHPLEAVEGGGGLGIAGPNPAWDLCPGPSGGLRVWLYGAYGSDTFCTLHSR